jgi:outer membrane protein assembly factor BamB
MTLSRLGVLALLVVFNASALEAGDWSRFRGPNGSGISSDDTPTPTKWSKSENLKWKAELPGPGVSSPIVVGDRVFVTCYSGYGIDRQNLGEIENLKRHLVCFDANSGDKIWDVAVNAVLPEDPYEGTGIPSHGYASHTPVSDGERVYVFFGKSGALAFDMDGEQLWQQDVGKESDPMAWGSASSPILYKDLVIVSAAAESQSIVALDKKTGEPKWKQPAAALDGYWGTPVLVEVDGEMELVMGVPREVWALNPDTGKLRWYCEASQADQANSSAVVEDGVIYVLAGRGGGSIAVRAGGKGDVTGSHVVWSGQDSARFGSPVIADGHLYSVAGDIVSAINVQTGKRVSQTRLEGSTAAPGGGGRRGGGERAGREQRGGGERGGFGGRGGGGFGGPGGGGHGGFGSPDYSSPVVADGKLYYVKGSGETHVFKLGQKLEPLSVNKVTDETESFGGTPAISDGRLFLRSNKHLYCVAEG